MKKKYIIIIVFLSFPLFLFSQVEITDGLNNSINSNAILNISSGSKGVLFPTASIEKLNLLSFKYGDTENGMLFVCNDSVGLYWYDFDDRDWIKYFTQRDAKESF